MMDDKEKQVMGAILGFAVGDALGVPVEHLSRTQMQVQPIAGMMACDDLPAGSWSDDTSMLLCEIEALNRRSGFVDYEMIMVNFTRWILEGYLTPWGTTFGVGHTTRKAILRFMGGSPPLICGGVTERDNGNGSLMRILPVAFLFHYGKVEPMPTVCNFSALTHRHPRSQVGCILYVYIVDELLGVEKKTAAEAVAAGLAHAKAHLQRDLELQPQLIYYEKIFREDFRDLPQENISSSGYIVDTLEAVIWCFLGSKDYWSSVLKAVNLGGDTDTVAALTGGLAGIYYGYEAIPAEWLDTLAQQERINHLCRKFAAVLE